MASVSFSDLSYFIGLSQTVNRFIITEISVSGFIAVGKLAFMD